MNKKKLKDTARQYTRHPAGSPGGRGGEFAPKSSSAKVSPSGSGTGSGTGARAGKGLDTSPLGGKVEDKLMGRGSSGDIGNLFIEQPSQMLVGDAKPDRTMVKAFSEGKINATPAFVVRTKIEGDPYDDYSEAIDPISAKILASAKAAGVEANTIVIDPSDKKLAALLQSTGSPTFVSLPNRTGFSDVGNLMTVPADEITGGTPNISQADVDKAAKAIRSGSGRALMPVIVRQTSLDSYEVISGAEQLAIAARANVDPWIYVADDFRQPPVEKLKKVARRRKTS